MEAFEAIVRIEWVIDMWQKRLILDERTGQQSSNLTSSSLPGASFALKAEGGYLYLCTFIAREPAHYIFAKYRVFLVGEKWEQVVLCTGMGPLIECQLPITRISAQLMRSSNIAEHSPLLLVAEIEHSRLFPVHLPLTKQQWGQRIESMASDEATSDCTIQVVVGNTTAATMKAHKCILAAHSPVFKQCFFGVNSATVEASTGVMRIADFGVEAVRQLLHYCYHGCLSDALTRVEKLADDIQSCTFAELIFWSTRQVRSIGASASNSLSSSSQSDTEGAPVAKRGKFPVEKNSAGMANSSSSSSSKGIQEQKSETLLQRQPERAQLEMAVFQLAHKYMIFELQALMEERLVGWVTLQNVIEMVVIADIHSASKLSEACIKLIAENWGEIFTSPEWDELKERNAKLANNLCAQAWKMANMKNKPNPPRKNS